MYVSYMGIDTESYVGGFDWRSSGNSSPSKPLLIDPGGLDISEISCLAIVPTSNQTKRVSVF